MKLSRLGVHEDWKGDGIGGRLLDHAEELVRDRGHTTLRLTTPAEDPRLPGLYRRRGYMLPRFNPLEFRDYDEVVTEKRVR